MTNPSGRSLVGVFAIIVLIAAFAILIASFSPLIEGLPILFQMIIYLVLGIVWIFPVKPLVRWMVSGHFRKAD